MSDNNKQERKEMDPKDLPQSEVFSKKEIYQHPNPADTGVPLDSKEEDRKKTTTNGIKEEEKTSKEEGLNEE